MELNIEDNFGNRDNIRINYNVKTDFEDRLLDGFDKHRLAIFLTQQFICKQLCSMYTWFNKQTYEYLPTAYIMPLSMANWKLCLAFFILATCNHVFCLGSYRYTLLLGQHCSLLTVSPPATYRNPPKTIAVKRVVNIDVYVDWERKTVDTNLNLKL